jgi:hypothetical protein
MFVCEKSAKDILEESFLLLYVNLPRISYFVNFFWIVFEEMTGGCREPRND